MLIRPIIRIVLLFCIPLLTVGTQPALGQSSDLDRALQTDDVTSIQNLNGLSPDSLLHKSVAAGAMRIARYALEHGADVQSFDSEGQPALLTAVNAHNKNMVALLLDRGANPDIQEKTGLLGTPLMYATATPQTEIARLLLEAGADVNALDMNNDPALNWASFYGHVGHMKLLIDGGADLSKRSKHGDAVDVVLRLWHADSVSAVFRNTVLAEPISDQAQAAWTAVRSHDMSTLNNLLKSGLDPNLVDELGIPLLHFTAETGNLEAARVLLDSGTNPNILNRVGQTALTVSSRFGQVPMMHLLLSYGADPNKTGQEYRLTALMGAAVNGNVALGRILTAAGAHMDFQDVVNDASALHWALFYGNQDFASFLIEAGADYNMKVFDGSDDALSLAEAYGLTRIRDLIMRKNKENHPLLGSWRVAEIRWEVADTTYVLDDVEMGRLLVGPSAYSIMYTQNEERRTAFKSLSEPTSEEMVAAFQSLVFNSGTYVVNDTLFTTTATIARVPGFEGGTQYYSYSALGSAPSDGLELTLFDETYPDGSKPSWFGKMKVHFVLYRE